MKPNKVKSMQNGKRIPEYSAWQDMRYRCYLTSHHAYKDYGGRGITVCERWINSFDNFIEDMGFRPSKKHTLDRKENDKNYTPENCRWATMKVQCNNRRSNKLIEHNGVIKTKSQWAEFLNVDPNNLLINKKKTFAQVYEHYMNGGGIPCIRITYNNETKKLSEWALVFKISKSYLVKALKRYSFEFIYNRYSNRITKQI